MAVVTTAVAAVGAVAVSANAANKQSKAANKANQIAAGSAEVQNQIALRQQDIAEEQWQNYKKNYLPLEQEYIDSAKSYGSVANQEKAAANAAAANAAAFSGARDQLNKTPGLDPNSQQYLRTAANLGIKEAAMSAASQTGARENVKKTGAAMLQDAASLGKGISGSAVAGLSAASGSMGSVASGLRSAANAATSSANAAWGGVGQMAGGLYQSGAFDAIGSLFKPSPTVAPTVVNGSAMNSYFPVTATA